MVIYTDIHTRSHQLPQESMQLQESLIWINIYISKYNNHSYQIGMRNLWVSEGVIKFNLAKTDSSL